MVDIAVHGLLVHVVLYCSLRWLLFPWLVRLYPRLHHGSEHACGKQPGNRETKEVWLVSHASAVLSNRSLAVHPHYLSLIHSLSLTLSMFCGVIWIYAVQGDGCDHGTDCCIGWGLCVVGDWRWYSAEPVSESSPPLLTATIAHLRSAVLVPVGRFITGYFIVDLLAMYQVVAWSYTPGTNSVYSSVVRLLQQKLIFIFHHLMFIFFSLTLLVSDQVVWGGMVSCDWLWLQNSSVRGGKGDWLIGLVFMFELSTPFLSVHYIQRQVSHSHQHSEYSSHLLL